MTKESKHLKQCIGKTLTGILMNRGEDTLILIFDDAWCALAGEGDDEANHLDEVYLDAPIAEFGFDPIELLNNEIISSDAFRQIMAKREQREAERHEIERNEFLRLKQIYEPEAT